MLLGLLFFLSSVLSAECKSFMMSIDHRGHYLAGSLMKLDMESTVILSSGLTFRGESLIPFDLFCPFINFFINFEKYMANLPELNSQTVIATKNDHNRMK